MKTPLPLSTSMRDLTPRLRLLPFTFHLAMASLFSVSAEAAVKLPSIFSDHMILQAGQAVPVWGWADPGEKVTVSLAGHSKVATAGADGKWKIILDPLKASLSGQLLTVAGTNTITVQDVLVGEVWLCSGQSNMALRVLGTLNSEQEIAAANTPLIRVFTVRSNGASTPQENCEGAWQLCSPQTLGNFSATAYYFGKELHQTLGVPVGLINSSVGGTRIESWTSAAAQRANPDLKDAVAEYDKEAASYNPEKAKAKYEADLAAWKTKGSKGKTPQDPISARSKQGRELGMLFNGKINPLVPYAIKGAIWYQGEANSQPLRVSRYVYQLPTLIQDWRKQWAYDFPFAWVQLPNFEGGPGRNWPLLREAQLNTLKLKNTGMAIAIDLGEAANIHPLNKPAVGRRLGLWALSQVYDHKGEYSGPLPAEHQINGDRITVNFTHAAGLAAKDGAVKGFLIAAEDHQWKPATAVINGESVTVSSPEVKQPVAVRYAWANFPDGNLYNGAGLPASPFRTDSWNDPLPPVPAAVRAEAEDALPETAALIPAAVSLPTESPKAAATLNNPSVAAPVSGANLVKDGEFATPINQRLAKGNWILTVMSDNHEKPFLNAITGYSAGNGALELDMELLNPGKQAQLNRVRLSQLINPLVTGGHYRLSFEAQSSEPGNALKVAVGIVISGKGNTEGGLDIQPVALETEFKPYQYEFDSAAIISAKANPKATRIEFRLGETHGKISLRNVRLIKLN